MLSSLKAMDDDIKVQLISNHKRVLNFFKYIFENEIKILEQKNVRIKLWNERKKHLKKYNYI